MRILGLACIAFAGVASAQPAAPTPAAVLARVQQHYANTTQMTAKFKQVVTNATFATTKPSSGELWVAKPVKLRWDYVKTRRGKAGVARSFVFDGTTMWMVDHDNKQIVTSTAPNGPLPAAVSFLTGGNLSSQFAVAFDASGTYAAKDATVLALTPRQPSAQYAKLYLVVDPIDARVTKSVVIDSNGNTNTFEFFAPKLSNTINTKLFQVHPPRLPRYRLVRAATSSSAPAASPSGPGPKP